MTRYTMVSASENVYQSGSETREHPTKAEKKVHVRPLLPSSDKQRIAEAFKLGQLPEGFVLPADFNIAPTTFQPVIRLNCESMSARLS